MAEGHEKFVYVGSCIELDGDLIDWVRGRQRDIGGPKPDDLDFEDFAKLVPASQFQHEGLNDDWHVRFYASSAPSGVPLLYYAHSGIEWVFAPRSSGFDPGMEAEIITAKLDAEYATPNRVKTMIDSAAFRRWFGDSVVVDEDGEPLVVYHGTDDDDFKSFRAEALPRGGRKGRLLGEGFYFTSDPDQAARWGRHVIAAYLHIENPRTQRGGLLVPASSDQDGTIAAGAPGTRDGEVWFVVKSPYQIKSATDNDGSFDPDDDHFTSNPDPASPLENPAFRRWFGDSVVVDEDGEPLVVYHGTDKNFDVFKTRSRSVNSTTFGPVDTERSGIFVSDNPEFSREFGRRLLPLYARIENPAEINRDTALNFAETIDPFGSERDLWLRARHVSRPWGLFEGELGPRFIAYLQELGHDGATFIEDVPKGDDVGEDEQEYVEGRTYVVFDPRQIKSATDNDGSFDPDDDHFTSNGRTFIPPQKVADEAAYGLYLRSQMPKSNRCCTAVGLARAKQLKNREPLSIDTLKRMRSYFERHEVDKRGRNWGVDSKGYQAWLLWGGDSGQDWCNRTLDHLDEG